MKYLPFNNREEYEQALLRFNHPLHKEAMQLREKRKHIWGRKSHSYGLGMVDEINLGLQRNV